SVRAPARAGHAASGEARAVRVGGAGPRSVPLALAPGAVGDLLRATLRLNAITGSGLSGFSNANGPTWLHGDVQTHEAGRDRRSAADLLRLLPRRRPTLRGDARDRDHHRSGRQRA